MMRVLTLILTVNRNLAQDIGGYQQLNPSKIDPNQSAGILTSKKALHERAQNPPI